MMTEQVTTTPSTVNVCPCPVIVRNANAARQAKYRASAKGLAAYEARKAAKRAAHAVRYTELYQRKHRAQALRLDNYNGPTTSGVPRTRAPKEEMTV